VYPKVDCQLVVGGFTQFGGLANYLRDNQIGAILDVHSPLRANHEQQSGGRGARCGIPCWRFHRPAWQQQDGDVWHYYQTDDDLSAQLDGFHVPLLSAGQMSETY